MKEITFIARNSERWKQFESILIGKQECKADELADLFVELTDDLSYARTNYPQAKTTAYLNSLAIKAHHHLYKNKKERNNRIVTFWTREYPLMFWQHRQSFLIAMLIFLVAAVLGAFSQANDGAFARIVMGDGYVDMTLENIANGDPMGVYASGSSSYFFIRITSNNILVSFYTFISGLFTPLGTAYYLFRNGVMLGCFQYFFYEQGVLGASMLSIWTHGTLEIFAIVVAGGAGMVLGRSIIFPGTYSRLVSFRRGIRAGLKILLGLVPIFIIAGFLESYVTRHTEWPLALRLSFILISVMFIIWYFLLYSYKLSKTTNPTIEGDPSQIKHYGTEN